MGSRTEGTMKYCLVHIPCSDINEARKISKALLDAKLVACCGLMKKNSIYWWKNEIVENDDEVVIEAQAREHQFDKIERLVKKLHSYDTPVIMATPIIKINQDAANWIERVTD